MEKANERFRKLVTLHVRVTLLSDIYATAGYQGRATITLLQHIVSSESKEILFNLGSLHRQYMWDNIRLKDDPVFTKAVIPNPDNWDTTLPSGIPTVPSPESSSNAAAGSSANGTTDGTVADVPSTSSTSKDKTPPKEEGPLEHNARALKHMSTQVPNALTTLFQCEWYRS